jgi:small-conductance mechanosensitive channel
MELLGTNYLGNTIQVWVIALALTAASLAALTAVRRVLAASLRARADRTDADLDDLLADLVKRTRWYFLIALALLCGFLVLDLPPRPARLVQSVAVLVWLLQIGVWGSGLVAHMIRRYVRVKMDYDTAAATTISAFGFVARLALWTIILFLALDNLGIDITALVAGLGVGGIAVALALQNILGDLFASFSIVLDKPFVIGDFIVVDDYLGTVEYIGLKTTRVRSLSGEQIIFSNSDLLSSRIRNYKRMAERRATFTIGVTYETPLEKLEAIPGMIRQAIENQAQTRFDRAHFKSYGDFALLFEVVYYVLTPDYAAYMNAQQAVNLELFRRFHEAGIEFPYPTQTLHLARRAAGGPPRDDGPAP